jgi:nicotinate-nucleotide--dimethylbenzimidazole phosphoribosyltransferase
VAEPLDAAAAEAARAELDRKTKPRASLGRLEELAIQLAGIGVDEVRPAIVVAAGDHGYADEGVSAYPSEVTRQMLLNFVSGGAAISVLAHELGAELVVVDAGVREPVDDPACARSGSARVLRAPRAGRRCRATTRSQRSPRGASSRRSSRSGCTVVALGEMGIGNTTAASALHAALLGLEPTVVSGPGTGLDEEGVRRKVDVVERALAANAPLGDDPVDVLAALGGYEIAFLVGVALGAAAQRLAVVLDGFIVAAAALVAARLEPAVTEYMVAAHVSPEPGHRLSLEALGLRPLSTSSSGSARRRARRSRSPCCARRSRSARHGDLRERARHGQRPMTMLVAATTFLTRIPLGRFVSVDGEAVARGRAGLPARRWSGRRARRGGRRSDGGSSARDRGGFARARGRGARHGRDAPRRARGHGGCARRDDARAASRDHARPRRRRVRRCRSGAGAPVRGLAARGRRRRMERIRRCGGVRALGAAAARRRAAVRAKRGSGRSARGLDDGPPRAPGARGGGHRRGRRSRGRRLAVVGAAAATTLVLGVFFRRWIGGVTGDTLGATTELAQAAGLAAVLLVS